MDGGPQTLKYGKRRVTAKSREGLLESEVDFILNTVSV